METHNGNRFRFLILSSAMILCFASCAHKKVQSSSLKEEIKSISSTIKSSDHEKFYHLLSEKQKIGIKKEDIQKSMEENKKEFKTLSSMLSAPKEIKLEATVAYSGSEKIKFILEDEDWRIEEGIFDYGKASTPGDACKELLKKFVILREILQHEAVIGEAYKKILVDSLDNVIEELTTLNARDIVIADDTAFIIFPSGRRIEFLFEEQQWKVTRIFPFPLK